MNDQNKYIAWAKQGNLKLLKTVKLLPQQLSTAMKEAIKHDRALVVNYLIKCYNHKLTSELLTASIFNSLNVARVILQNGHDVNSYNTNLPLNNFIKYHNCEAIDLFFNYGLQFEKSYLLFAARQREQECLLKLFQYTTPFDVKQCPNSLLTAIHAQHFDIANLLLDNGLSLSDIKDTTDSHWSSYPKAIRDYITSRNRYDVLNTM